MTVVLPARAGVGVKHVHVSDLLGGRTEVGFIEVHAENYMGAGGPAHAHLAALRELYPLSLHGVGLSIGGSGSLDEVHLERLAHLVERYRPHSFSEHLAWSTHGDVYFNDLLPVAYDTPTLDRVVRHIDQVQDRLGLCLLLENPSTYVEFTASTWDEPDFINEILRRTGCGLLLDINNVRVSTTNHGRDPLAYLDALDLGAIREVHLAGYTEATDSRGARLLLDSHSSPVRDDVWDLYRVVVARAGPQPTLIEWDNDVPPFEMLIAEVRKAEAILTAPPQ